MTRAQILFDGYSHTCQIVFHEIYAHILTAKNAQEASYLDNEIAWGLIGYTCTCNIHARAKLINQYVKHIQSSSILKCQLHSTNTALHTQSHKKEQKNIQNFGTYWICVSVNQYPYMYMYYNTYAWWKVHKMHKQNIMYEIWYDKSHSKSTTTLVTTKFASVHVNLLQFKIFEKFYLALTIS